MGIEEVLQLIGRCACEVLPNLAGHRFEPADQLSELGANSVDRAEIIMLLMEELSLKIPRSELFGPQNIGELAELILLKMRSPASH